MQSIYVSCTLMAQADLGLRADASDTDSPLADSPVEGDIVEAPHLKQHYIRRLNPPRLPWLRAQNPHYSFQGLGGEPAGIPLGRKTQPCRSVQ